MRGIRQVASIPIPTLGASDLGVDPARSGTAGAKVTRVGLLRAAAGQGRGDAAGQPGRDRRQAGRADGGQRRVDDKWLAIFAYVEHKAGVADDSAAELAAAARAIDARRLADGPGDGRGARNSTRSPTPCVLPTSEVWKIAADALATPTRNWSARPWSPSCRPAASSSTPHNHFGLDLSPGPVDQARSGLRARRAGDRRRCDGHRPEGRPPGVRRTGERARSLRHLASGAVISIRPGAFKPVDGAAGQRHGGRQVVGGRRPDGAAALPGDDRRRVGRRGHHQVQRPGLGRPRHPGAGQRVHRRRSSPTRMGAALSCSRPVVDAKWLEKSRQVGSSGQDRQAQGVPGLRHQRLLPAPGRHQGEPAHRRDQQERQGAHLPGGRRGHRRRHPRVPAGTDGEGPRTPGRVATQRHHR